uniref:Uncharacterized protein n=1 Tax=Setaria viridis TaxID=4556 RepID=A0A4U6WHA2_SETVI|nr:hypothetical protein SEVIR_1G329666v2 [Setaria viridis]
METRCEPNDWARQHAELGGFGFEDFTIHTNQARRSYHLTYRPLLPPSAPPPGSRRPPTTSAQIILLRSALIADATPNCFHLMVLQAARVLMASASS